MAKLTPRLNRSQISARNQSEAVMRSVLRTYAKVANQRLRQLEKDNLHDTSSAYRQIKSYWEDDRSFMDTTKGRVNKKTGIREGAGLIKFKTNFRGMNKEQLRQELLELDTFLFRAKTSTSAGVKSHYEKIKESIGKQNKDDSKSQAVMDFFNNMSMKEFSQFWEYTNMSQLIKAYGSDTMVELIEAGKDKEFNLAKMNELFADILNDENKKIPITDLIDFVRKSAKGKSNKRASKMLHHKADILSKKGPSLREDQPMSDFMNPPVLDDNPILTVDNPMEDIPFE